MTRRLQFCHPGGGSNPGADRRERLTGASIARQIKRRKKPQNKGLKRKCRCDGYKHARKVALNEYVERGFEFRDDRQLRGQLFNPEFM